ncbi:hypothetical protein MBLNU459_g7941t1 [Dothideomycetes sp. NU459]
MSAMSASTSNPAAPLPSSILPSTPAYLALTASTTATASSLTCTARTCAASLASITSITFESCAYPAPSPQPAHLFSWTSSISRSRISSPASTMAISAAAMRLCSSVHAGLEGSSVVAAAAAASAAA